MLQKWIVHRHYKVVTNTENLFESVLLGPIKTMMFCSFVLNHKYFSILLGFKKLNKNKTASNRERKDAVSASGYPQ